MSYTFIVSVKDPEGSVGAARAAVDVNTPPSYGSCAVDLTNGTAVIDTFTVSASGPDLFSLMPRLIYVYIHAQTDDT